VFVYLTVPDSDAHAAVDDGGDGDEDASAGAPPVRVELSVQVPQLQALKMELSRVTGSLGSALVRARARCVCGSRDLCPPGRSAVAPLHVRALLRLTRARRRAATQSASVAAVVGAGCELEARPTCAQPRTHLHACTHTSPRAV
jgi:hypothetical protein